VTINDESKIVGTVRRDGREAIARVWASALGVRCSTVDLLEPEAAKQFASLLFQAAHECERIRSERVGVTDESKGA
jgi:hypothetical protein